MSVDQLRFALNRFGFFFFDLGLCPVRAGARESGTYQDPAILLRRREAVGHGRLQDRNKNCFLCLNLCQAQLEMSLEAGRVDLHLLTRSTDSPSDILLPSRGI